MPSDPAGGGPGTPHKFGKSILVVLRRAGPWALVAALGLVIGAVYFDKTKGLLNITLSESPRPGLETEAAFVESVKNDPITDNNILDEWRAARGEHKIIAYAIANCSKINNIDILPRNTFSALLLDLRPQGDHYFENAGDNFALLASTNSPSPLSLSSYEQTMLLVSDAVARARIAAAAGAAWNYPDVTRYGWYAVFISAAATLFITLKSAMSSTQRDTPPPKWIKDPKWWRNFAFSSFGILAIVFSTLSTVLTSAKQFYDPTRAYLRNEIALASLRNLHERIALAFVGTDGCQPDLKFHQLMSQWTEQLANLQKTIIKAAVPIPGIDGASDQNGEQRRPENSQGTANPGSGPANEPAAAPPGPDNGQSAAALSRSVPRQPSNVTHSQTPH